MAIRVLCNMSQADQPVHTTLQGARTKEKYPHVRPLTSTGGANL